MQRDAGICLRERGVFWGGGFRSDRIVTCAENRGVPNRLIVQYPTTTIGLHRRLYTCIQGAFPIAKTYFPVHSLKMNDDIVSGRASYF